MCVQRIQEGKLNARKEKRKVADGEVKTACMQVCPTEAIVFGDMLDNQSKIAQLLDINQKTTPEIGGEEHAITMGEPRAYHVLEEINVRPGVAYLTKIRNKDEMPKIVPATEV